MTRTLTSIGVTILCLVAALVVTSKPAWSQTTGEIEARALFEEGVRRGEAGEHVSAVELLTRSYELYQHPGTLVNLGFFQVLAEQPVEAYRSYRDLIRRFQTVISEEALSTARARLVELEGQIVRVRLSCDPPEATVIIDGQELEGSENADVRAEEVLLEEGSHRFEASLQGFQTVSQTSDLRAGENVEIELTLEPDDPPLPVVRLTTTTRGAQVIVDNGDPEPLPLSRELEPGIHHLRVEAPDHQPETLRVDMPDTGEVRLDVDLDPDATPTRREGRSFWRGPWPWVIGTALILGTTGAVLGVTLSEGDERNEDWRLIVR